MDIIRSDGISKRIEAMCERVNAAQAADQYFFNMPVSELRGGSRVLVDGREMRMFASYSYLGLIGHPRITAAAHEALEKYGTGTHGVRVLAGTLPVHVQLEEKIAAFKGAEAAVTFSSGYVTNLTCVSALVGRHDYVFSDKLNHASIVDGCLLSGANFVRFRHKDMADLKARLSETPAEAAKLVVTDAVFSMDGDIADLPNLARICHESGAWLMIDEAHSLGVLGQSGHGIEEHFNLPGVIDINMGTLSKTIPSVGGYIAGGGELVSYLRHQARGYVFSAALPPAQAAAALEAFRVIEDEPWRVDAVQSNADLFINGLKSRGLDTLHTQTAVVPIVCGEDETAFRMTSACQREGLFVLPVVSPAVPVGLARLRATVTAAHTKEEIDSALDVFERAGKSSGVIL
jgi:8-amino-7-oxononanoate synthase